MGQSITKATTPANVSSFVNFPKEAIFSLWTSYNLLGEGWGLSAEEVIAIFNGAEFVVRAYGFSDHQIRALFDAFDTDRNGLVDALELFVAIALTSGMDSIDKLYFVFNAYDFDSVGSLSYDEVTLLLRSVIKGLAKMSPSSETFNAPGVRDAEKYATLLFEHFQKDPSSSHHHRVAAEEFRQYYSKHPVSSSWLSTTARMNDAQPPVDEQDFALDVPLNEPRRIVARNPLQDAAILSEDDHARLIELQEEAEQLLYAKRELAAKKKQQQQQDSESQDEAPAEEDEEAAALRAAAAKAAREAIDPRAPAWVKSVELMRPEELPEGVRSDPPEDVFEPLWVTGIITERDVTLEPTCSHSSTSTTSIPMPALVHRCVRYGNMNPNIPAVPDPDAPSGDEDSNSPPPVPAATLLAAAGSHLLYMRKDEELGWIQKALTSHSHRITCMDVHYGKNIIITAENSGESHRSTGGSIVIWHLDSLSVRRVITTPQYGVKLVNISENGTYFIAVSTDLQSTLSMYEVETGTVVFTRPLLLGPRVVKDAVIDVMFTKSTSLFAVSSATAGLTFFIEEGGSFMGPTGLKVYEERVGLYPSNSTSIGKATAEGGGGGGGVSPPIIITELCRFEKTDELVAGTLNGQILLWRGRTCAQLLQPTTGAVAAAGAINALDFNVASMTLISGNVNGVINMYSLVAAATVVPKSSSSSRGPQIIAPRLLELTATFDILRHQLCSYSIRSLSLSVDSRRALVSTAASEVLEIALYLRPPTAEELAEEEAAIAAAAEAAEALAAARAEALAAIAAAAEADGDEAAAAVTVPAEEEVVVPIPAIKKLLGDDLHNGPILSSHFKAPTTQEEEKEEEGVLLVTCLCRVPLGGFASCGSDGTVRWWQAVGGNEEVGTTGYRTSKVVKMDSGCSAVDACANAIAVALTGSDPNPSRTGSVHLFSLPETTFIIELRDHSLSSLQAISALKFSPEGNLLAAASQDGAVYVYQSVEGQWSLKGKCGITTAVSSSSSSSGGQSSFVSQLDFSSDGLYIRCFYGATDEFKIFDVSSAAGGPTFGKDLTDLTPPPAVVVVAPSPEESGAGGDGEDPAATTGEGEGGGPIGPPLELLRGLTWASHNCAVNWDTKGALSFQLTKTHSRGGGGGTGRGPACTDRFNHLLVTALGTGDVSVERVPSIQFTPLEEEDVDAAVSSRPVSFRAHLSQVSALTFIDEGARLVTAGSHDGMLRVWKVNYDMDEFEPDPHPATASSFEAAEEESTDEPAEEEEEEAGEGKPKKLPVIYDSGEDDDVIDLIRLKEHLSRDNNSKRRTLYEQQQRKQRRAKEVAALRAAAREELAATARELGQDPITTTATEQEAADDAAEEEEEKEYVPSTDISEHSGVKLWGECIGLKVETMTQSCGQALASSSQHTLVPSDELELSWVYGCSVRAAKASVHYSREGMIVYPAGCLAVIYNKKQHSQLYAMPHCDEITCMDVHVASGLAVSAHKGAGLISVCLWRTVDGAVLNSFPCGAVNGVSAVKLSPDAKLIAAVCQDHQHTVLLFDVKEGKLLTSYHSGPKKSLCIAFSQAASSSTGTLRFIVGGLLGFKLVTYIPARTALTGKSGLYGASEEVKKSNVLCVGSLPMQVGEGGEVSGNEFILGMSDGSLGLVGRGESKVSAFSPALKGPVTALYVVKTKDGTADEPPAFKIVVGGTHGQLKVLDGELQPIAEWNLYQHRVKEDDASSFGGLLDLGRVRGFKSLCVDKMNRKILFGTAGGEIGELDFAKGTDINSSSSSGGSGGVGPLVSAHFRDQLHAMCVHPLRQECATAGDDKTLRIWQLEQKRMFTSIDLPDIARTVTFSPNGHLICAGLGGVVAGGSVRNPREMTGKVLVISYLQGLLRIVHTTADAEADITCVIFTPDGSKLLASSKDGRVYIYDALNNFVLIGKLEGVHKEGVRLLDISADGLVVTSTGTHDEFFVWNLSTLSVIGASSPTERYEVLSQIGYKWCVRQSPFGLNSIGIFPPFSDPADALTLSQSSDKKLLVAGDSFGALKLFSNPCTDLFAPYKRYFAHSPGGISKVSFTVDDQYLLSIGRSDKVLAQWRVLKSNIKPDAPTVSSVSAHTAAIDGGYGTSVGASSSSSVPQGDEDFLSSFTVKGVNFLTDRRQVKPFDSSQHPELKARIQSVVGTGNSAEQSSSSPSSPPSSLPLALFFGKGDLLTSIGKYPVLLDGSGKGMQKLFSLSSSSSSSPPQQVSTLAVSSDGKYALIGHSEGGRLVIVGTPSGELVIELSSSSSSSSGYPRPRPGGITAVAFSEDSSYCACLRGDAQHSLMLFRSFTGQWTDGVLVYSAASVTAGSMYLLSFIPTPAAAVGVAVDDDADESTTSRRPFTLVTAGAAPIRFWTLAGLNMHSIHGDYGEEYADSNNSNSNKPIFSSIAAIVRPSSKYRGQILTGDTLGTLFFWRHGKVVSSLPLHSTAITALKVYDTGIITGSFDKLVICSLDDDISSSSSPLISPLISMSIFEMVTSCAGFSAQLHLSKSYKQKNKITCIDSDPLGQRIAISCSSSPIMIMTTDSRSVQLLSQGHGSASRVVGIAAVPGKDAVLTFTEPDCTLRLWDVSQRTIDHTPDDATALLGCKQLNHQPTAAVFLNASVLLVAIKGADTDGKSASILIISVTRSLETAAAAAAPKYNMIIFARLHNIGTGAIRSLVVSPRWQHLAACSEDGCVYMYRLNDVSDVNGELKNIPVDAVSSNSSSSETKDSNNSSSSSTGDAKAETWLVYAGILLAHPSGTPVSGLDFSDSNSNDSDGRFIRTFGDNHAGSNGKVEVCYFDMQQPHHSSAATHAAAKVQDPETLQQLRSVNWSTVSSAVAPEVSAVSFGSGSGGQQLQLLQVGHIAATTDRSLVCASFADGSVKLYRYSALGSGKLVPSSTSSKEAVLELCGHSAGAVWCCFLSPSKLVTVGRVDGAMFVWHITA